MKRLGWRLAGWAAALFLAAPAFADVVHLKSGRTLEGTVEEQGEMVRVTTRAGVVTLGRGEIVRIERTASVEAVYREKRSALPAGDAAASWALALWAREQGLRDEYLDLARVTLGIDPRHAEALQAIRRALVAEPLAPEPAAAEALLKELGAGFQVKQSAHYLVAYNCDEAFVTGCVSLLERLFQAFYGYFQDGDFPLAPLRRRLVVVIYGSRPEFVAASHLDLTESATAGGFYSVDTNRSVFFAITSDEDGREVRETSARLRRQIAEDTQAIPKLRRDLDQARRRGDRTAAARLETLLDDTEARKEQLTRADALLQNVANWRVTIVLHEATHQLILNTGLLRNPAGDPRWLHEGFAMLFESAKDGAWRGLATPNSERARQYRDYKAAGRLPTLKDLLVTDEVFYKVGRNTMPYYSSAWGLLYYLSHRRRADLNRYLALVAARPRGPVSPEARVKDFSDAFGDIEPLEADWRQFMDRLKD